MRCGKQRVPIRREGPLPQRKPRPPTQPRRDEAVTPPKGAQELTDPTPVSVSPRFRCPAFTADGLEERVWWNAPQIPDKADPRERNSPSVPAPPTPTA